MLCKLQKTEEEVRIIDVTCGQEPNYHHQARSLPTNHKFDTKHSIMLLRRIPHSTSLLLSTKRTRSITTNLHLHRQQHPQLQRSIMAIHMQGRCVCKKLQYSLDLDSPEAARTTLCHCHSCRRAFGTNYGLTAKVPLDAFKYEAGSPRKYKQENGVTREFCENCGAFICEYGVSLLFQGSSCLFEIVG